MLVLSDYGNVTELSAKFRVLATIDHFVKLENEDMSPH